MVISPLSTLQITIPDRQNKTGAPIRGHKSGGEVPAFVSE